jgi:VIT1/CCC1 family predicted Fe2+/Mn2+ transporter
MNASSKLISRDLLKSLRSAQRSEYTEYYIYRALAKRQSNSHNQKILEKIADEEKGHGDFWKQYTQMDIEPDRLKIWFFVWISRLFGLTFGVRLMERGEINAQFNYEEIVKAIPEGKYILEDEKKHEQQLIELLHEKKLEYMGSVVLGLNDALVELTGALAGLSFAFQNTHLIAITGLITGIAASFSMAASEFLSNRADENENAGMSALYTGLAYISTVILLIIPFFTITHYIHALATSLAISVLIIFVFNFYLSVAKNLNFWRRFLEMAGISLGVSALSFGIGVFVRLYFGIEI